MGFHLSLEGYKNNKLIYKLNANSFNWDTIKHVWIIRNYTERYIDGPNERLVSGFEKDTVLGISPVDFTKKLNIVSAMRTNELTQFIEEERKKGSENVVAYELELHQRTSYPFSAFVLTFIGAVIANKKVRGGIGLHLAAGVAISMIYILFMKTTNVMSTNAGLSPLLAVWIPNILFAFFGFYLYQKAQK
jgi:lipopolysaccharide export system permease protein